MLAPNIHIASDNLGKVPLLGLHSFFSDALAIALCMLLDWRFEFGLHVQVRVPLSEINATFLAKTVSDVGWGDVRHSSSVAAKCVIEHHGQFCQLLLA